MLLYSASKEFVGIDEKDLKTLGFKDFLALRHEVEDFADLFVKTPGHIHNFKHVHWIDFIVFSESNEEFNVVIHANAKNFKAKITIESLYLNQTPSLKSYAVYLNNLRELTKKESENISADVAHRPSIRAVTTQSIPEPEEAPKELYTPSPKVEPTPTSIQIDPYETPLDVNFDDEDEIEIPTKVVSSPEPSPQATLQEAPKQEPLVQTPTAVTPVAPKVVPQDQESFDNGYIYDPHVASQELGLPLDLIEEFIQDFILQAKEFRSGIYNALDALEFDQVKILSHKLKGVAANLRIEDAFEALSVVNTSHDINAIKEHLELFYKIIAKLAKEELIAEEESFVQEEVGRVLEDEDEYVVAFKDETPDTQALYIDDAQVPQKIEIAELADDEFTSSDVDFGKLDEELKSIEDLGLLELDSLALDPEVALELEEEALYDQAPKISYSKESVAAEIGLDAHSFAELFDDYVEESKSILSHIKSAALSGDFVTCSHEAVKLQGMSDNMRVYGFESELAVMMSSDQRDEIVNAANSVSTMILDISK